MVATLRTETDARVTLLELFFDLVFVLALTQCTALMADDPTWRGLGQGMLVLAALWWSWTGYAWLTSVVDPEEGAVRLAMFAAMAALLVVSLCVPEAFGDLGLLAARRSTCSRTSPFASATSTRSTGRGWRRPWCCSRSCRSRSSCRRSRPSPCSWRCSSC
jgi:hypothetical protein